MQCPLCCFIGLATGCESDYLPRVGEDFALWHPRVCKDPDIPFLGVVESVTHEAYCGEPPGPEDKGKPVYAGRFVGSVHATVCG